MPCQNIFSDFSLACKFKFLNVTCDTGWRRLIGSPKLQIIFRKRATKYKSLVRKMTYKDKGSCESSPPCTRQVSWPQRYSWHTSTVFALFATQGTRTLCFQLPSHMWMSHVAHMNEWRRTREWVMSHILSYMRDNLFSVTFWRYWCRVSTPQRYSCDTHPPSSLYSLHRVLRLFDSSYVLEYSM